MYKLYVRRTCELKSPFDITVEANNDWTHFTHLHRDTIADYRLLYKQGNREIFLYKGCRLPPLPLYDYYVVFRNYKPEQHGYQNVYLNVRTGTANYLDAKAERRGDTTVLTSDYLFNLPWYWRYFRWLFLIVFKARMRRIMDEDNSWIYGRMTMKTVIENPACAPTVPDAYDLFEDWFKQDMFKDAGIEWLNDRAGETFDGRGRLKVRGAK